MYLTIRIAEVQVQSVSMHYQSRAVIYFATTYFDIIMDIFEDYLSIFFKTSFRFLLIW